MRRGGALKASAIAMAMALLAVLAASAPAQQGDRDRDRAKPSCEVGETRPPVRLCIRGGRGAEPGKRVRYRFGVRNRGTVDASDVTVIVRLPKRLEHVRGGRERKRGRRVEISLGRLRPGQGKSRALVARVGTNAAGKPIVVRATVRLRSPVPPSTGP